MKRTQSDPLGAFFFDTLIRTLISSLLNEIMGPRQLSTSPVSAGVCLIPLPFRVFLELSVCLCEEFPSARRIKQIDRLIIQRKGSNMNQVYFYPDKDPEMQAAKEEARATFRYFWRELSWEYRRIVPALDMSCVKVPFEDPPELAERSGPDGVEEMWMNEIRFNGKDVTGTLLNSPNWLKSISLGDQVRVPLEGISDWMYAVRGKVYGAYTVNLMRLRMSRRERAEHDSAWGLDFGDPAQVRLVPDDWSGQKRGFFSRLFGGRPAPVDPDMEHPMAVNMGSSLKEFLSKDASNITSADDEGFTMLHQLTMAGTVIGVRILLEHGADPNAKTNNGMTPLSLAKRVGWKAVAKLLQESGAH
jgi:uncharacterized protein YegJ (DUF2314 family)